MKLEDFKEWSRKAKPGSRVVYYSGFLMAARETDEHAYDIGRAAWRAYTDGEVSLTQRRVEPHICDYIAEKR